MGGGEVTVGMGVDKYDGMSGGEVGIFVCGRKVEINNNFSLILFCSSTTSRRTSLILLISSSKRAACIKKYVSDKTKYAKSSIC